MSMSYPATIAAFALATLGAVVYLRSLMSWNMRSRGRPLPPGPRGLPLVGNMFDMPKSMAWIGFRDLCARYGSVVGMRVFGRSIIVFGTPDVAFEFLEKRSANTSDRVQSPSLSLTGHDWNFGLYPYGPKWRHQRRVFWQHFSPAAIPAYESVQIAKAHRALSRLVKDPGQLEEHIQHTVCATMLKVAYGIDAADENDDTVVAIQEGVVGTRQVIVAGGFLVDFLPVLKYWPSWLPGGGFHRQFAQWRTATDRMKDAPWESYMREVNQSRTPDCMVTNILAKKDEMSAFDATTVAKAVGAVTFEAGSDTTFSLFKAFFLAMALYPEVQKKAQAELDAVVGHDRMPEFTDRESLVYVNAILKELLRWIQVLPLGLAHSTTEDDEFMDYFIPAGATLLVNIWACMHDPEVFENPDEFCPERFIRDGKLEVGVRDPEDFVYGFGRRICPGRHFGNTTLFINIACVLHIFNITPPVDGNGRETEVDRRILDGLVSGPVSCHFTVKPRAGWAEALLGNVESS